VDGEIRGPADQAENQGRELAADMLKRGAAEVLRQVAGS